MLASCVDVDDEDHDGGECEVTPPRSNSQSKRLHSEMFPHGGGGTRGSNMFRNRSRKQSTQNRTGNPNFGVVDVDPYGAWGPGERNTWAKPNNCRKSVRLLIVALNAQRSPLKIRLLQHTRRRRPSQSNSLGARSSNPPSRAKSRRPVPQPRTSAISLVFPQKIISPNQ